MREAGRGVLARWPGSATGLAFTAVYAAVAAVLFGRAFTCTGWVCDLVSLPAAVPVGFAWAPVLDWLDGIFAFPGYSPAGQMRSFWFIVPTVLGNLAFYYGLGSLVATAVTRLAGLLGSREP